MNNGVEYLLVVPAEKPSNPKRTLYQKSRVDALRLRQESRTWESLKEIMAPGALDPLTKELLYVAISVTNNCAYCIASHTAAARKAGMTDAMFGELQAVVGMANETNRLATGYRVPVDEAFKLP